MNRNAAAFDESTQEQTTVHKTAITRYLNKEYNRVGSAYLYKMLDKNFTTSPAAIVRFMQLPLDRKINRILKRTIDIILSVIVIITVLSWLIPLIAILLKATSRGPVFFLQKRSCQHGAIFTCIKFRSMYVNKEADILPATENDTRITPLGRIMRKRFIDELPQFFNVLWGDMSVIGPRPHMLAETMKFEGQVPYYKYREKVKPGITGLSQIMGLEGAADTTQKIKDRVEVDIFYLRHWTLKLDGVILYRTICKMAGL